ncbi:hypothetical protein HBH74_207700 [Parastagonospora nodorum]|nr:hypothetical protein HBH74_207700 [Parastagonospora nodorum]
MSFQAYNVVFKPLLSSRGSAYFRLLQHHPSNYNDMIQYSLEVLTYEGSKDQYEAVSYCWGDQK